MHLIKYRTNGLNQIPSLPFADCYDPAGTSPPLPPSSFASSAKKSIVVVGADGSSIIHHIGVNDVVPMYESTAAIWREPFAFIKFRFPKSHSRNVKTIAKAAQEEETSSTSSLSSSIPESRFSSATVSNSSKLFREPPPTPLVPSSTATQRSRKFRKEVATPPASSSGLGSRTVSAGGMTSVFSLATEAQARNTGPD